MARQHPSPLRGRDLRDIILVKECTKLREISNCALPAGQSSINTNIQIEINYQIAGERAVRRRRK
jgi:hypothetical protein